MPKHVLAIACVCLLTFQTQTSHACDGIVVEVTLDIIKIEQGGIPHTFMLSNDLQTNTEPTSGLNAIFYARPKEVKKGDKVDIENYVQDGVLICKSIRPRHPNNAGFVTEVGIDTMTIRNDKGETTFYKVKEDLVHNSRVHYSPVYPNRFSEVKVGCRVEITCYKKDGEMVLCELDVKKDKAKDK